MRLIDADELIKTIKANHYQLKSHLNSTDYGMFTIGIQYAINEQTTVDAVPVVRCGECKYIYQTGRTPFMIYCCKHNNGLGDNVKKDDFCSYGEISRRCKNV